MSEQPSAVNPADTQLHGPPEEWQLKWNPHATVDWPEKIIKGCHFGPNSPLAWPDDELPRWLRSARPAAGATSGHDSNRRGRSRQRLLLAILAASACAWIVTLLVSTP